MKTKLLSVIILVSVLCSFITPQNGGQPGAFLRRGVDSKALALGNAYTSVVSNASSVFWNPAGLSSIEGTNFLGMFSLLTLDRQEMFFSLGHSFRDVLSIGFGWYKFGVKDIDGRDRVGNQTKKFDDSENSIMLSLSKKIEFVSFGVTMKYLNHSLYDKSASGFGIDVGSKVCIAEMFNIGIVLQDLGGNLKWNTENNTKEDIPLTTRGGVSFSPDFIPATFAVELAKTTDEDIHFRTGAEYRLMDFFGVRAGYNNDLTFGGFVKLSTGGFDIAVDYAATNDILENNFVHHISLIVDF